MITKQFRITFVLLALVAMAAVAVSAWQIQPPVRKVKPQPLVYAFYLKCNVSNNDQGLFRLIITNNTSSTVPQGKQIHWSVNSANKGSFTLQQSLAPGGAVEHDSTFQSRGGAFAPKAWYYKSQQ